MKTIALFVVPITSNFTSDLCNGQLRVMITFLNIPCLHAKLTDLLLTPSAILPCLLYDKLNSLINILEGERS